MGCTLRSHIRTCLPQITFRKQQLITLNSICVFLCQASDVLFELFQVKIISDMEYRHIVFRPHCKFLNSVSVKEFCLELASCSSSTPF